MSYAAPALDMVIKWAGEGKEGEKLFVAFGIFYRLLAGCDGDGDAFCAAFFNCLLDASVWAAANSGSSSERRETCLVGPTIEKS